MRLDTLFCGAFVVQLLDWGIVGSTLLRINGEVNVDFLGRWVQSGGLGLE